MRRRELGRTGALGGGGAAGVLEGAELFQGLIELMREVALVADEAVAGGVFGENALGSNVANLAVEGALGGALAIDGVAGGGGGVGDQLIGVSLCLFGDRRDELAEALDRPVRDVDPGDVVWGDLRDAYRFGIEAVELSGERGEDEMDVTSAEGGIWRAVGEGRGHGGPPGVRVTRLEDLYS